MKNNNIYLDYASTTPVDHSVVDAMIPFFSEHYGNPGSIHSFGQEAHRAVLRSRETIAHTLNCLPEEVIFTSGGSESDNLAIRGAAFARRRMVGANHILTTPVEHEAVLQTVSQLRTDYGFDVEYLQINGYGQVDLSEVHTKIRKDTAIVSVIYANNEIGSINPIAEIGAYCREYNVPFHTDALQAVNYLPIDVKELCVDLFSVGAHKFYGPKGVGALFVRNDLNLIPAQTGGGQEFGKRAGTLNVPYILGMAEALQAAVSEKESRTDHVRSLRDSVIQHVLSEIPDSFLTGHPSNRTPNHASFVFSRVDGNALVILLDLGGFACSSNSACKTGDPKPSKVLTELGISPDMARGSLRVTLGHQTTSEEISCFLPYLIKSVEKIRNLE